MANWDILREFENLKWEIDEALRGAGFNRPFVTTFPAPVTTRRFPLINFSEDDGNLYLAALIPGVDPKDIDLSVVRNSLTISGDRKVFEEKAGQIVHRYELGSGKFSRTVELPTEINPDEIKAECKDGIIKIILAKAKHAIAKKIEIKAT